MGFDPLYYLVAAILHYHHLVAKCIQAKPSQHVLLYEIIIPSLLRSEPIFVLAGLFQQCVDCFYVIPFLDCPPLLLLSLSFCLLLFGSKNTSLFVPAMHSP